ncbi:MAG: hypothetical protein FWC93_00430 [Defluviitaleaceae bacterium]|nr:hypothetical protein [Defluviitaleaceae bacterium]
MNKWKLIDSDMSVYLAEPKETIKHREQAFLQFINKFAFSHYIWNPWIRHWERFLSGDKSYNSSNRGVGKHRPPYANQPAAYKSQHAGCIMYTFHESLADNETSMLQSWCADKNIICFIYHPQYSFWDTSTSMVLLMHSSTYEKHQDLLMPMKV